MSSFHRHLYLAAYDIRDHGLRAGALALLRGYATGGQKSVHEVWLTDADRATVLKGMKRYIDSATDRFTLWRLDPRSRSVVIGRGEQPADPDYFYVG